MPIRAEKVPPLGDWKSVPLVYKYFWSYLCIQTTSLGDFQRGTQLLPSSKDLEMAGGQSLKFKKRSEIYHFYLINQNFSTLFFQLQTLMACHSYSHRHFCFDKLILCTKWPNFTMPFYYAKVPKSKNELTNVHVGQKHPFTQNLGLYLKKWQF